MVFQRRRKQTNTGNTASKAAGQDSTAPHGSTPTRVTAQGSRAKEQPAPHNGAASHAPHRGTHANGRSARPQDAGQHGAARSSTEQHTPNSARKTAPQNTKGNSTTYSIPPQHQAPEKAQTKRQQAASRPAQRSGAPHRPEKTGNTQDKTPGLKQHKAKRQTTACTNKPRQNTHSAEHKAQRNMTKRSAARHNTPERRTVPMNMTQEAAESNRRDITTKRTTAQHRA